MTTIPGNINSTIRLNPNETIQSTLDFLNDQDWFRTNLTTGITYGVSLVWPAGGSSRTSAGITLRNSNGLPVIRDAGSIESFISFTPQVSGRYYISVDGNSSAAIGTYTLHLSGRDTVVNNVSSQTILQSNQTVRSAIDVIGDADYYRVQLAAGFSYGFTLSGTGTANELRDNRLDILHSNGNRIINEVGYNDASHIGFTPSRAGTYFVVARENGNNGVGDYFLRMNSQDNVKGDVTTTAGLALNTGVTGRIDTDDDRDFYRVVLRAGQVYTVRIEGDGSNTSLKDTSIALFDAAGNQLLNDSTVNGASEITFNLTRGGTFYIGVAHRGGNRTGDYQVMITGTGHPISGGAGNDTLIGDGAGNSIFGYRGDDVLLGQEGDDFLDGGIGRDILIGGFGVDTAVYRASNGGVSVDLLTGVMTGGYAQGDALHQIENVIGSDRADTIRGDHTNNAIWGQAENDTLVGRQGADMLDGGGGNDTINGGSGADRIFGRNGNDVLDGNDGNDRIFGGTGNDRINGGNHNDTIDGEGGSDTIFGGPGADTIRGNAGNDIIDGNNGFDTLSGGSGNDVIRGGMGNDRILGGGSPDRLFGNSGNDTILGENGMDSLFGGLGNDRLNGGQGTDILQGDGGNDVFVIANGTGNDTIVDMRTGDRIDVSNHTFINNFNQVRQASIEIGNDVLIGLGTDSIRIEDMTLAQLNASDFIF